VFKPSVIYYYMKILSLLKLTLVISACGLSVLSAAKTEQPNILFIFADDLSYETIRAHGHLDIDTPNLDRLVAEGTTFSHAYNMGSWTGAVCMASRSMINTGQFVWRTPRKGQDFKPVVAAGETWSQLLKSAGYRTYMTGKWHVPMDAAKIFDIASRYSSRHAEGCRGRAIIDQSMRLLMRLAGSPGKLNTVAFGRVARTGVK
jgi:hypothetical protein